MIDRQLLQDIGFVLGHGFQLETWVYDGMFWVTFGKSFAGDSREREIDALTVSRQKFFRKFLRELICHWRDGGYRVG